MQNEEMLTINSDNGALEIPKRIILSGLLMAAESTGRALKDADHDNEREIHRQNRDSFNEAAAAVINL